MRGRFEPDSGRGQAAKRLKGELIRRNFLIGLALLDRADDDCAAHEGSRASPRSRCTRQGLEQRHEEQGRQEERALVALSTQLEKAKEPVQLALYRTNRVGRSARLHRRDVLVRSRASRSEKVLRPAAGEPDKVLEPHLVPLDRVLHDDARPHEERDELGCVRPCAVVG